MIRTIVAEALSTLNPVERLKARHASAVDAVDKARSAFADASLAAEMVEGDKNAQARQASAASDLAAAENRVRELTSAVEAATAREAICAKSDAAAEFARRWDATMEHVAARDRAANDCEQAIMALAEASARMEQSTVDAAMACPVKIDLDAGMLRRADVAAVIRLGMVKRGFPWAIAWPWGAADMPSLPERINKASRYVSDQRGGR